tara:strand:- start:25 stop:327 length:303 start_codon:yes stop_codon:yes gene_type:complete
MSNITRDKISEFINNEFGLAKKDCDDIVNALIEQIIEGLIKYKVFKIHNFGTFKIKQKKSRLGRNPKTKEEVIISARNVISFTPSKKILLMMNNKINEKI